MYHFTPCTFTAVSLQRDTAAAAAATTAAGTRTVVALAEDGVADATRAQYAMNGFPQEGGVIAVVDLRRVYPTAAWGSPVYNADTGLPSVVRDPQVLDITDVTGRRVVETAYLQRISVREENAAAALEVMSRFAVDPRWLLYLLPTMSPVATSTRPDLLEHPEQAFEHYRGEAVDRVVCHEKHMGSRAVALVCRSS